MSESAAKKALIAPDNYQEPAVFFEVTLDRNELGVPNSLRHNILTWVLDERYDSAIAELKEFLEAPSPYPQFKEKITRFVNHSIDLIYAIKAKRSFPGINSLTRAKQQDLREKFREHFRELKHVLKVIERIQADLRLEDARSTIYVVKAAWIATACVAGVAFWLEIRHGLAATSWVVIDDLYTQLINWCFDLFGW